MSFYSNSVSPSAPERPFATPPRGRRRGFDVLIAFVVALVAVTLVRTFIMQPFFVRGNSMEPTFSDGDYLVVDEWSYHLAAPARGDVVIFKYPNNPSEYFIKRVIGLPGEKVVIKDNSITVYNDHYPEGTVLPEADYLPAYQRTFSDRTFELSDAEYAVLGDNRVASSDSRSWGTLPAKNIVGKAWLRVWPFNVARAFEHPTYAIDN